MADAPLLEFAAVMRRLRAECPWKQAQTHESLARYLLEETYETLEALDTGDPGHLREELGDLLLQVYFHAMIAEEAGDFTLDDVAADITDKMRHRNPHVFGDPAAPPAAAPGTPGAVNELWEQRKATEKARTSVTDGLPPALPALLYAAKLLDRLERAGRPIAVAAPTEQTDPAEEIGDRLLDVVADARSAGVDPEQALRQASRRLLSSAERPAP